MLADKEILNEVNAKIQGPPTDVSPLTLPTALTRSFKRIASGHVVTYSFSRFFLGTNRSVGRVRCLHAG